MLSVMFPQIGTRTIARVIAAVGIATRLSTAIGTRARITAGIAVAAAAGDKGRYRQQQ